MTHDLKLFIDGSVHTQSKIGFGAYLAVSDIPLSLDILEKKINIKQFQNTSSTTLELQNLLWALNDITQVNSTLIIYTDSQNIVRLPSRREKLERNNYYSRQHTRLKNHELYQAFYKQIDTFNCEFINVKGHKKTEQKDTIDTIFSSVDRAARHALRRYQQTLSTP